MKKLFLAHIALALAVSVSAALNAADRVDRLLARLLARDIPDIRMRRFQREMLHNHRGGGITSETTSRGRSGF